MYTYCDLRCVGNRKYVGTTFEIGKQGAENVRNWEKLFFGTVNSANVHPREVVKRALHHNAAAVILSHNHPSGVTEPSDPDRCITRQLQEALQLVDVRVLDHVIVGGGHTVSLAERGMI